MAVTLLGLNVATKVFKFNFYNSNPINMLGMLDMNGEKTTERSLINVKCISCYSTVYKIPDSPAPLPMTGGNSGAEILKRKL